MPQFSEQDLILLNGYLDGRLSARERAGVEARLARDADLRAEMEALRQTIGLLKMAERVPVPRNFSLEAARYGKPAARSLWDRLGLASLPGWAFAGASLVVALLCLGAVVLRGGLIGGGASAPSVAMQPQAQSGAQRAAAPLPAAPLSSGASTEAPAEGAGGFATESVFSGPAATQAGGPSVFAPAAPGLPAPPAANGSAQGSGGAAPVAGAPIESAPPQPTQAGQLVAPQAAPTAISDAAVASKAIATPGQAAADQAHVAGAATPQAVSTLAVVPLSQTPGCLGALDEDCSGSANLTQAGTIILAGVTVALFVIVLVITALMRRRNR